MKLLLTFILLNLTLSSFARERKSEVIFNVNSSSMVKINALLCSVQPAFTGYVPLDRDEALVYLPTDKIDNTLFSHFHFYNTEQRGLGGLSHSTLETCQPVEELKAMADENGKVTVQKNVKLTKVTSTHSNGTTYINFEETVTLTFENSLTLFSSAYRNIKQETKE